MTLDATNVYKSKGVEIPVYDFENFEPLLKVNDNKTRVINFWATWCKPCVAELPYFELINSRYSDNEVEVVLVSLDLPQHVETKLIPFITKQHIQSKVILLDDPDSNSWIPKVDGNWSGSIPATIIYKGNTSTFYERSFTYNELEKELKKML
ncbi:TlpA disulfide reductase family protein [Aquimarina sp. U1-2]|uniref:TlpA family protein disulfide reductase n=1 Tax=Aquimarina sp. U1-2 TaxID=2823141 RepID=UPI001FEFBE6D|nr:TlpA disulfide reductase family protein [Aquimarina sp. U1-2]